MYVLLIANRKAECIKLLLVLSKNLIDYGNIVPIIAFPLSKSYSLIDFFGNYLTTLKFLI